MMIMMLIMFWGLKYSDLVPFRVLHAKNNVASCSFNGMLIGLLSPTPQE